jgi:hypothetical protein
MEVAMGVGSLVLLAAGVAAALRRTIRPTQALGVLGIAAAVAVVALLADLLADRLGGLYRFAVVAPTTVAGIVMAVSLATRPPRRGAR